MRVRGPIEQASATRLRLSPVSRSLASIVFFLKQTISLSRARARTNQMGLLTVLRKVKQKERELRVLIV